MNNLRKHGRAPYTVAVIHGGPGAAGEMAPVARELAHRGWGVLEPFQTAETVDAQTEELKSVLEENENYPVTLVGFSWGAWLSYLLAAKYPAIVRKLILIGSGSYEEKYAARIQATRLRRLKKGDRAEIKSLFDVLDDPLVQDKSAAFARIGKMFSKADSYDPIESDEVIAYRPDLFQKVWKDAAEWRRSGKLLAQGGNITCPVIAIHGDHDPHPAEGVRKPLSTVLKDFRFILLKRCGHMPWIEREAREQFYRILQSELD